MTKRCTVGRSQDFIPDMSVAHKDEMYGFIGCTTVLGLGMWSANLHQPQNTVLFTHPVFCVAPNFTRIIWHVASKQVQIESETHHIHWEDFTKFCTIVSAALDSNITQGCANISINYLLHIARKLEKQSTDHEV
jgi:hypothetical protein